jgi:HTH-type transcriptional regulator / antitoxin HigA
MKMKKAQPAADHYMELIHQFPLRPLRTAAEYDAAQRVLDTLAVRDEATLTSGESDYLDVLSDLVEKYDDVHHQMPLNAGTPLERLRHLIEQSGMSASDLGRLLGTRTLGTALLAGKRELSKTHIRTLSEHFKVDPGYFL